MEGRVELLGFPDVSALQKTSPEKEGCSWCRCQASAGFFLMVMN